MVAGQDEYRPTFEYMRAITDAHLTAIGRVASNWSQIEQTLAMALWRLTGLDNKTGTCLTAQIPNLARMLDALIALARLKGTEDNAIRKLGKFAERTFGLQEERNRVVHDVWTFDPGLISRWPHTAKRAVSDQHVEVTTAEVEQLAIRIQQHGDSLRRLLRDLYRDLGLIRDLRPRSSP
jgi:hypothetical protein